MSEPQPPTQPVSAPSGFTADRLHLLVGNLRNVVFETDGDGRWTFLNPAWEELTGYTVDESLGRHDYEFLHPDELHLRVKRDAPAVHAGEQHFDHRTRYVRKDGSVRHVEVSSRVETDDANKPVGTWGTMSDVTERQEAHEQIATERNRLQRVMEATNVSAWRWEPNTDAMVFDDRLLTGIDADMSESEPTGTFFMSLVHPDDLLTFRAAILRHIQGDTSFFDADVRIRRSAGGWAWLHTTGHISERDAEGAPLALEGVHSECTERVMAQQAIRRTQKAEAIGQMSGGIAHDFNNLLAIILGSVSLIDADSDRDEISERLHSIEQAAQRAADLTSRIMRFANDRVERGEVTDGNQVVADAEVLLDGALADGIDLELRPGHDVGHFVIDRNQFQDVLLNLVLNARDAIDGQGQITVETARVAPHSPSLPDQLLGHAGEFIEFTVSDSGHGIDDGTIGRIFEPFFTTKEERGGTGLGLAVASTFVQRVGGAITVDSEVGVGTSVRLYFPLVDADFGEQPITFDSGEAPDPCDERLLVVDDDEAVRDVVTAHLSSAGYEVVAASDGSEALGFIERDAKIVLLLADIVMPGLNGYQLSARAVGARPDLAVVLSSGLANPGAHADEQPMKQHSFLPKPYTRDTLLTVVRTAIDQRNQSSAATNR